MSIDLSISKYNNVTLSKVNLNNVVLSIARYNNITLSVSEYALLAGIVQNIEAELSSETFVTAAIYTLTKVLSTLTTATNVSASLYTLTNILATLTTSTSITADFYTLTKIASNIASSTEVTAAVYTLTKVSGTLSTSTSASCSVYAQTAYIQDVIAGLGYTTECMLSVRKATSTHTYAGLIYVSAITTYYKVGFDSNGLLTASSPLYDVSDVYQGTVQTVLIDNSYASVWQTIYDAVGSYDFDNLGVYNMPSFTDTDGIIPYSGSNGAFWFQGLLSCNLVSSLTTGADNRTIIILASDWTEGYAVAASNATAPAIFKNASDQIEFRYSNGTILVTSTGTLSDSGIVQAAVAYCREGFPDNKDCRIFLNGTNDSTHAYDYTLANRNFWIGRSYYTSLGRMLGAFLQLIIISDVVSDADMATIYASQVALF